MQKTQPEPGKASIIVSLSDSTITVQHASDTLHTILFTRKAKAGDWDKIFEAIKGNTTSNN